MPVVGLSVGQVSLNFAVSVTESLSAGISQSGIVTCIEHACCI